MRFLCLAYYDVEKFEAIDPGALERIAHECREHDEALRATGKLESIGSLEAPDRARVIRPGRQTTVTDGPFMETKEQLGSVFLIDAADVQEAVRIASLHPAARMGEDLGWAVEVRRFEHFDG
jgi:hypothetical protein